MYTISIIRFFSSAHSLREYTGKCEALHGHNWKVEVFVASDKLDKLGMVIDFKVLKARLDELLEKYDHVLLNNVAPFDTINPSSENIARVFYEVLSSKLNDDRVKVQSLIVWESENSKAIYSES